MSVFLLGAWAAGRATAFESARIDAGTALISSDHAPLAANGGDAKAVWCAVPPEADGSVVVFLHGNDGFVTASADRPEGYVPAWAPRTAPPRAVGPAYHLADLAEVGPLRPVVLAPEIGIHDSARAAWAVTSSGRFADPSVEDPLGGLITDAILQLRGLSYSVPDPRRVVVAAHSGGGRVVAAMLGSKSLRSRPIDVVLLDATYGWGDTGAWVELVRSWQGNPATAGNRLVLAYLTGTGTQVQAAAVIAAAKQSGVPVATTVYGTPGFEDVVRSAGVVGLAIPRGVVSHGGMPADVLPALVRTARP